ncbi:hypothetical protein G6F68_017006 [Rhizopus microsporus]|nr:hypothetical protein G6F68_017006 [Rhizopus microsporus]
MFKTFLDPIDPIDRVIQTTQEHINDTQTAIRKAVDDVLKPSTVYLRPETAQGVFVNFEQVMRTMKTKPPFGIAQVEHLNLSNWSLNTLLNHGNQCITSNIGVRKDLNGG